MQRRRAGQWAQLRQCWFGMLVLGNSPEFELTLLSHRRGKLDWLGVVTKVLVVQIERSMLRRNAAACLPGGY